MRPTRSICHWHSPRPTRRPNAPAGSVGARLGSSLPKAHRGWTCARRGRPSVCAWQVRWPCRAAKWRTRPRCAAWICWPWATRGICARCRASAPPGGKVVFSVRCTSFSVECGSGAWRTCRCSPSVCCHAAATAHRGIRRRIPARRRRWPVARRHLGHCARRRPCLGTTARACLSRRRRGRAARVAPSARWHGRRRRSYVHSLVLAGRGSRCGGSDPAAGTVGSGAGRTAPAVVARRLGRLPPLPRSATPTRRPCGPRLAAFVRFVGTQE